MNSSVKRKDHLKAGTRHPADRHKRTPKTEELDDFEIMSLIRVQVILAPG